MFNKKIAEISKNNKKIAVVDDFYSFSYEDLLNFTYFFIDKYNLSNEHIGLYFEKSSLYIASLYMVTLSNNLFVPLDKTLPEDRLKYIISHSDIKYILTSKTYNLEKIDNLNIIFIEDIIENQTKYSLSDNIFNNNYTDSAYIIYTSGSTGFPKGVEVSYSGLYNIISQQIEVFNLNQSNIFLYLSISFDASLSDIYCSFLSNSTLYINEKIKKDINYFVEFLNNNNINYIDIPPSILKVINPKDLKTIKTIVIGGEVVNIETVKKYCNYFKLINVYGPTEATICTSYSICNKHWNQPSIGKPMNNIEYLILDEYKNTINEPNIIGELYISGICLAKKYYKNDEMTKEKFLYINNKKYYKTGDYVFLNENYDYIFIGRKDRQIKLNGNLISLEEIENNLNNIPEIKKSSVIFKNNKIICFFEGDINKKSIIYKLKNNLPDYMIPHFFECLHEIPQTITGKNDLSKLKTFITKEEQLIIDIFKKILNIDSFDLNESFKDLGADSLDFIELQTQLEKNNLFIPFEALWNKSTIYDILNSSKKMISYNLIKEINTNKLLFSNPIKYINNNKKNILITGSTGFLGTWVLNNLQNKNLNIFCFVRNKNDINKIKDNFIKNNLSFNNNFHLIEGDLSCDYFNMDKNKYLELSNKIDVIYHCAGEVNNLKPYSELSLSNIESTKNILKFLNSGKNKNLNYASTLSVYVSRNIHKKYIVKEEPLLFKNYKFHTDYAATKYVSECIIQDFKNQGANVNIFRFGLLMGDSINGFMPNNTFFEKIIKIINKNKTLPIINENISLDITPIDYAAEIFVKQGLNKQNLIFNVSLNYKLTYNELIKYFNEKVMIEEKKWLKDNKENELYNYLSLINDKNKLNMNLFETTYIKKFENNNIFMDLNSENDYNIDNSIIEKYIRNVLND